MITARQHHYIPQFYLKGFAKKPHLKAKLYIFDMIKGGWLPHPTNPKNIGTVRDFNRINIEGCAPDALEASLSAFETKAAEALRHVCETKEMPGGENWDYIINLIALIGIRNPRVRKNHSDFITQILEEITDQTLATKESWESSLEQMKRAGYGSDLPDIPYEEILQFHEEKQYTIKISNGVLIPGEFNAVNAIIKTLTARKWTFLIAGEGAGHFVCCDHPVRLRWSNPRLAGGFHPPGHAVGGTEVIFPLSKDLALIGTYESNDRTIIADKRKVAMTNTLIIEGSDKQIYSPNNDFNYLASDGFVFDSNMLIHYFRDSVKKKH